MFKTVKERLKFLDMLVYITNLTDHKQLYLCILYTLLGCFGNWKTLY